MNALKLFLILASLGISFQLLTGSSMGFRILDLFGIEVPGLGVPVASLPDQVNAEGKPQVLVYGPLNCPSVHNITQRLEENKIPYLYKNISDVSQEELGSLILSTVDNPSNNSANSTALVLVNGKVMNGPTVEEVLGEYNRAFGLQTSLN